MYNKIPQVDGELAYMLVFIKQDLKHREYGERAVW